MRIATETYRDNGNEARIVNAGLACLFGAARWSLALAAVMAGYQLLMMLCGQM